jgi:hypothetical protein
MWFSREIVDYLSANPYHLAGVASFGNSRLVIELFLAIHGIRRQTIGFNSSRTLVVYFINTHTFAAMDFGRRLGASDAHIPKWICKERATTPPSKRHAARRVAPNLACGFVARSVEYRCGYTPSLTPRHRPNSEQRTYAYL